MPIGTKAELSPQGNGATGTIVLFAPREFTVINFSYNGQCPVTDIRLGMEGFPKPPVAVLEYLAPRAYQNESLTLSIPPELPAGSANAVFVYCNTHDSLLGWGRLIPPP